MLKHILVAATLTCTPAVLLADEQAKIGLAPDANNTAAMTAAGRQGGQQMSQQDMTAHFFKEAASVNELEIRLADLAQQRSQNDQVKQIAQHIKQDHQQANQALQQMAKQANVQVSPGQLERPHQAILEEMQQKQGEQFDRAFVFGNVASHQKSILMYQYMANKGQGPAQQYAQQVLPKIQEHYQQIQPIAQQMAGGGMAAGSMQMDNSAQPAAGSIGESRSAGSSDSIDTSRVSDTSRSTDASAGASVNTDRSMKARGSADTTGGSMGASGQLKTGSDAAHNVGTDRNSPTESGIAGQNTAPQRETDTDNQSSPNKMGISTGENR
ncbi:MAG TPA: DUF4142 domain-containing protein [Tepidisphaeraceae bacterium]|nr:DUF4142 domain-containing protein [Tepidisphaeraceae bacterium]